jgi:periplasmic divalent cation tolerance protein
MVAASPGRKLLKGKNMADIVLFITTADIEEAQRIADLLVKKRKAACVNIVPRVNSLFWWQDKVEKAEESLLIVKSQASLLDQIVKMVKKHHSYDVPEVIALPIIGGNPDYLEWLAREVK